MPIAIPEFIAGSPGDVEMARTVDAGDHQQSRPQRPVRADRSGRLHRADRQLRRRSALCRLARHQRAGAGGRPRRPPGRRPAQGRVPPVGRARRPAAGRQAVPGDARQHPAHRPHHLRPDLRAAHRREGLFRQPRRVHRRDRPARAARQAVDHDGPGRGERALSHPRRGPRAHAALLARLAGDHLHVVRAGRPARLPAQHRERPARGGRQFPRHDLRAALLARRRQRDHEPAARRQLEHLRDESRLEGDHPADRLGRDRHRRRPMRPTPRASASSPIAAAGSRST